jgi:Flp pilus assembly protein TadD
VGKYREAILYFTSAIELDEKGNPDPYVERGFAFDELGDYDQAVADYNLALAVNPVNTVACNNLAWLQATCPDAKHRDGTKAVEIANKGYQSAVLKSWACLDTLAAAYAESGNFEKAKQWQAKAVEMGAADKLVTNKDKSELRSRLELYKHGKPYRQEPKKATHPTYLAPSPSSRSAPATPSRLPAV